MDIVEVTTKQDLKDFIDLPWKIYKNYPHWVPPLKKEVAETLSREKNPFFRHSEATYFIVKEKNEILGRIATIQNKNHNSYHNDKVGFFGFFEIVENYKAAELLFNKAKEWCKERGLDALRGPTSFSTNDECGFLIDGFDKKPAIMMPYNPPYYISLLEKYGFKKSKDLLSFFKGGEEPTARIQKLLKKIKSKKIKIRTAKMRNLDKELHVINDVYNSSWSENWGFVPMTEDEVNYMAQRLKSLADPALIYVAEISEKPAAFSLSMLDYNQILKHLNGKIGLIQSAKFLFLRKNINRLRLMAMGVKKEFRSKGIELLLCYETLKSGKKIGLLSGEIGWVLEDNISLIKIIEEMGGVLYKKYRIFEIPI